MELIFFASVGLSVAALTPLALPLVGAARDSVRFTPVTTARGGVAIPEERSELEAERSVRLRLYGERPDIAAAPIARHGPRQAMPPGCLVGGRYRLLEQVGEGVMATVYRARDERLKREVAVKVIAARLAEDPRYVRRFRDEAGLCARLAHPNIVSVLDAGVEPRDFVVMEFVDGLDAGRLVHTRGRLAPDETIHLVAQVSDALAYAHDQGVLHCDLSLPNILVRRSDGAAKLTDFGLAAGVVDAPGAPAVKVMGTPGYVAPEILSGAEPTPRSDLYSLGVVTYRLLAGARAERPPRLMATVQRALADEPGARHRSVAEFRAQLMESRSAVRHTAERSGLSSGVPRLNPIGLRG